MSDCLFFSQAEASQWASQWAESNEIMKDPRCRRWPVHSFFELPFQMACEITRLEHLMRNLVSQEMLAIANNFKKRFTVYILQF